MPVNTSRTDYDAFSDLWSRLRDCFGGRDKVIAAGHRYVPNLPGLDHAMNQAYRARGNFYNAVSRTVFGLVGAIFQKEPVFTVSSQFESYLEDVTLTNVTMEMFSLEASHETMLIGRYGVLVDMAKQAPFPAPVIEVRPYFVGYQAEDIINWRTERQGGEEILTLVVLRESVEENDAKDPFILNCVPQFRVCQLLNGVYAQQLWRKKPNTEEFIPFGEPIVPERRGAALTYIPFIFLGSTHVTPHLQQPAMIDLANVNLAHWRNSVDHEHGLHLVALPTPWVAGIKGAGDGKMKIGPSQVWELDKDGKAGMLEFTGAGLRSLHEAMEEKKKEMATLGARMLEAQEKMNETATAVLVRHSADYASLKTIAQTVEQGLTMLLQIMCWWMGTETKASDVTSAQAELNKEFMSVKVDPQTIQVALTALQSGNMSFETFYAILQQGGWTRDGIDAEAERAAIDKQTAALAPLVNTLPPDPNAADPNAPPMAA